MRSLLRPSGASAAASTTMLAAPPLGAPSSADSCIYTTTFLRLLRELSTRMQYYRQVTGIREVVPESHQCVERVFTLSAAFKEEKTRVMACAPASLVSAARSAPTYPGVFAATAAKSKVPSNLILLARTCSIFRRDAPFVPNSSCCILVDQVAAKVCAGEISRPHLQLMDKFCRALQHIWSCKERRETCRILTRAAWLGMPKESSRSNLPARRSAGSSDSGLFVAPIQHEHLL